MGNQCPGMVSQGGVAVRMAPFGAVEDLNLRVGQEAETVRAFGAGKG